MVMFSVLTLTGCGTTVLQNANDYSVFYVPGSYWVGGMGSMPILESVQGNVKEQDSLPIFVDEKNAETIRTRIPSCYVGDAEIKVTARIQLEEKSEVMTSIPPDENGNQPTRSFYSAKILELKDVKVKAEPCEEEDTTDEKFALIEEPQDAVFYIATGMDGGMGSMPVLGHLMGNTPIFFDESYGDDVRNKLPSCYMSRPEIKILAKIKLENHTGINVSIPPDENGNQPEESYYTARVLELKNIEVKAEACKD